MQNLSFLFKRCQEIGPITAGFVYPCSEVALTSCLQVQQQQIFIPIVIGPKKTLETMGLLKTGFMKKLEISMINSNVCNGFVV
jgi:hypothetical protein